MGVEPELIEQQLAYEEETYNQLPDDLDWHMVTTQDDLQWAEECLATADLVGFDCEWRPELTAQTPTPSLLQERAKASCCTSAWRASSKRRRAACSWRFLTWCSSSTSPPCQLLR